MQELNKFDSGHNSMWLLLYEIFLPGEPGGEEYELDLFLCDLLRILKQRGFSPELQLRVEGSILEAMRNAVRSEDQVRTFLPVFIQVFVEENNRDEGDPFEGIEGGMRNSLLGRSPPDASQPGQESQDIKQPIHRGWGYFLVEKTLGQLRQPTDSAHNLIQLFIYKEGSEG
jgi:hypothetical protein